MSNAGTGMGAVRYLGSSRDSAPLKKTLSNQ